MKYELLIIEDMHIHSTFSDGVNSIAENIAEAEAKGLEKICCVDHVRKDTDWLPEFIQEVEKARKKTKLKVLSGIETKLLNSSGELDMPADVSGIDCIYVADHQFPLGDTCRHPREIREMIVRGELTVEVAILELCMATINAMERNQNVVLAHLFSVLPKAGLDEIQVPVDLLEQLADTAKRTKAKVEIDERWKCPSLRTATFFHKRGVEILFSTDSHRKETIGVYRYNKELHQMLY